MTQKNEGKLEGGKESLFTEEESAILEELRHAKSIGFSEDPAKILERVRKYRTEEGWKRTIDNVLEATGPEEINESREVEIGMITSSLSYHIKNITEIEKRLEEKRDEAQKDEVREKGLLSSGPAAEKDAISKEFQEHWSAKTASAETYLRESLGRIAIGLQEKKAPERERVKFMEMRFAEKADEILEAAGKEMKALDEAQAARQAKLRENLDGKSEKTTQKLKLLRDTGQSRKEDTASLEGDLDSEENAALAAFAKETEKEFEAVNAEIGAVNDTFEKIAAERDAKIAKSKGEHKERNLTLPLAKLKEDHESRMEHAPDFYLKQCQEESKKHDKEMHALQMAQARKIPQAEAIWSKKIEDDRKEFMAAESAGISRYKDELETWAKNQPDKTEAKRQIGNAISEERAKIDQEAAGRKAALERRKEAAIEKIRKENKDERDRLQEDIDKAIQIEADKRVRDFETTLAKEYDAEEKELRENWTRSNRETEERFQKEYEEKKAEATDAYWKNCNRQVHGLEQKRQKWLESEILAKKNKDRATLSLLKKARSEEAEKKLRAVLEAMKPDFAQKFQAEEGTRRAKERAAFEALRERQKADEPVIASSIELFRSELAKIEELQKAVSDRKNGLEAFKRTSAEVDELLGAEGKNDSTEAWIRKAEGMAEAVEKYAGQTLMPRLEMSEGPHYGNSAFDDNSRFSKYASLGTVERQMRRMEARLAKREQELKGLKDANSQRTVEDLSAKIRNTLERLHSAQEIIALQKAGGGRESRREPGLTASELGIPDMPKALPDIEKLILLRQEMDRSEEKALPPAEEIVGNARELENLFSRFYSGMKIGGGSWKNVFRNKAGGAQTVAKAAEIEEMSAEKRPGYVDYLAGFDDLRSKLERKALQVLNARDMAPTLDLKKKCEQSFDFLASELEKVSDFRKKALAEAKSAFPGDTSLPENSSEPGEKFQALLKAEQASRKSGIVKDPLGELLVEEAENDAQKDGVKINR